MYKNPNPACTKTLNWRQPNERNVTGSSITINFHSRWGKKTYLKAQKMFEISQMWFAAWTRFRNNYSRKNETVNFSHKFCSYFIGCGFAYRAKSWIHLRTNMCITVFIFLSPGSCFKCAICNPNSLESAPIALFLSRLKEGKIIHKKSVRAPFTLIFHSEAKYQRSNLSV